MFVNSISRTQCVSIPLSNSTMADVLETRLVKLNVLIAEAGSLKAIGDAMRRAAAKSDPRAIEKNYENVLSQHRGGKPIGHRIARLLETSMGKPKGWMDTLQEAELSLLAKEAGQILMAMKPEQQDFAMKFLRTLNESSPQGPNNPFPGVPKGGAKPKPRRRRRVGQ